MAPPTRTQLRDFIAERFSRDELGLLCTDYFPDFYRDYADTNIPLIKLVNALIEHCERRDLLDNLRAAAHAKRPDPYESAFGRPRLTEVRVQARNPRQVFISHAHADADFGRQLAQDLREAGLAVWIAPDNIQPGELWAKAIDRGLRESGIFVVALSPAAAQSSWVEHEMFVAIGFERKREMQFIPLLAQTCDMDALPALLGPYQFVNFESDYAAGLAQVLPRLGVSVKTPLPKDLADALDDPRSFVRKGAVDELVRLLTSANAGLVSSAREALQHLAQDDDSVSVRATAQAVLPKTQQPAPPPPTTTQTLKVSETFRVSPPPEPMPYEKPAPASPDIVLPNLNFRLELVRIPAGPFTMGGDGQYDGKPIHEVTLPEYLIGKYPVINQQYAIFAQAAKRKFDMPRGKEQHPVVNVTWKDALAFCEWLSQASNRKVVLPSEAEWEKAARSADARPYPWGSAAPDKSLCNFNTNEEGTTPVGQCSPKGDSPFGCADMAGNVWQWTRSEKRDYPYRSDDGCESLEGDKVRVVRGGSWAYDIGIVRSATRSRSDNLRLGYLGFRVGCVSAPVS